MIDANTIKGDPSKQQIYYTITQNDGDFQKYMTMLPREFDQSY